MHFTSTSTSILTLLQRAKTAMVATPPLVAYTGVLLRIKNGQLYASGSDGETTVTVTAKVGEPQEGEALIVPAALMEYLSKLPGKETLIFKVENGDDLQVVRKGRDPYRFRQLGSTFPPPATGGKGMLEAKAPGLKDALSIVKHANSGVVQLRSTDEHLTVAATDSYRIARVKLEGEGFGNFTCIVNYAGALRLVDEPPTHVGFDAKGRVLRVKSDTSFTVVRLVDEPFPDVDAIADGFLGDTLTVDAAAMLEALGYVVPVAGKTPVKLEVVGGTLSFSAANVEVGAGKETIDVANASGELSCYVNGQYLSEALGGHSGNVTFGWNGDIAPLHFRSTAPHDVRTVVMPVQA